MRPRELWFSLAAASLVVGTVFTALAVGYYLKEQSYALSPSPHMISAYGAFAAAFLFFGLAVAGWGPWLRLQRFPDITVLVQGVGWHLNATTQVAKTTQRTTLLILKVYVINMYADRNVCIRAAYLRGKTKPGWLWGYWQVFTEPKSAVEYDDPAQALDLPLNLPPRAGAGGYLIFELPDYLKAELAAPGQGDFAVEIIEALSGQWATFPALAVGGVYRKGNGLTPTTTAERVTGPPPPPVYTRGSPWEMNGHLFP